MYFDFATLDPVNRYKLLTSTVTPRPIAWLTTVSGDGQLNAAPFSFFNAVSGTPPLIVIGIGEREPNDPKDSSANIRESGEFVVNLVSEATVEQMNITATDFPRGIDEVAEAGLTTAPSLKISTPRIAESPAALECTLYQMIDIPGGQVLVIGQVQAVYIADGAVLDPVKCYIDAPALKLVGRMHGGGWYAKNPELFEVKRVSVAQWTRKKAEAGRQG